MATIKYKNGTNWNNLVLDAIYPIGTIYIAYNNTSPATRFGGTWSQLINKFLRMANNVTTGGSDTVTLQHDNVPAHSHSFLLWMMGTNTYNSAGKIASAHDNGGSLESKTGGYGWTTTQYVDQTTWEDVDVDSHTPESFSNMPAYQNLYAWRRTA